MNETSNSPLQLSSFSESDSVNLLKSPLHDSIAEVCNMVSDWKQTHTNVKDFKHYEIEIGIRPDPPLCEDSDKGIINRSADLGLILYRAYKNMLESVPDCKYEVLNYFDFFYPNSVRQRVWSDNTNRIPEWTRKKVDQRLTVKNGSSSNNNSNSPLMTSDNQYFMWHQFFPSVRMMAKTQIKQELPIIPLPQAVRPIWGRRKKTTRFCLPTRPGVWIDLSEVKNVQFHPDDPNRKQEVGPFAYELEIEFDSSVFLFNSTSTKSKESVTYEHATYPRDLWVSIGQGVLLQFDLLNQKT